MKKRIKCKRWNDTTRNQKCWKPEHFPKQARYLAELPKGQQSKKEMLKIITPLVYKH